MWEAQEGMDDIWLTVVMKKPGGGCMAAQSLTPPYHPVAIRKSLPRCFDVTCPLLSVFQAVKEQAEEFFDERELAGKRMVAVHQKELRPGSAGEADGVCHRDNLVIPAVDYEGLPCPGHRVRFGIAGEIDGRCHEEEPRRFHLPGGNRRRISAHAGTDEDNGTRFPGASCHESVDPRLWVREIGVVYALDVKSLLLCYGGQR